ncbi:serine hydrolase domain-containing protein [Muriicola sp. Z0-33]|uniref:serine hydrolase domain-containing protein n=1 Tax=Muriicola sp. Z0-33 TaxID=2816957 RepID=UPI002238EEE6|nr:serine hydrolase [Muriicola sp. Z0-33]MCW5518169.1 serine hydrolase [Muriicola sp. Z0-33]
MKNTTLFSILLFLVLSCNTQDKERQYPTYSWETSSFETEGLKKEPFDSLLNEIGNGAYGNVDQLLLIKNGKLVFNQSFTNDYEKISKGKSGILGCGFNTCQDSTIYGDYNYYHPNWHPYYQNKKVHTLQSVTKSIASIMIGVAIKDGDISSTDVRVVDFFEDYDLSMADESLKTATLENLLTMQLGMEWHELDRPPDSTNTTGQLERSKDWIQFTFNQPMDTVPGTKWVYNSGASQLMSGIIKKATGLYIDEYAEKYLFTPLGIENFHWKKTPAGYTDTEGGLFLEAQDLAKIGFLMLNNGIWDGQQIISSDWAKRSISKHVEFDKEKGYGYQWWREDQDQVEIWACKGFGGQYLLVFPKFETIAVVNSWNIFDEKTENILKATKTAVIESNSQ